MRTGKDPAGRGGSRLGGSHSQKVHRFETPQRPFVAERVLLPIRSKISCGLVCSPFNTLRVINTVKLKLLSVFLGSSAADYLSRRTPKGAYSVWSCIIRRLWAHGPKRYFAVLPFEIRHWHIKFASDHTSLVGRETQPSVGILINELVFP